MFEFFSSLYRSKFLGTMDASKTEQTVRDAVFAPTTSFPLGDIVRGYDFGGKPGHVDYEKLLASYLTTGFQATNFGLAVEEINKMVR